MTVQELLDFLNGVDLKDKEVLIDIRDGKDKGIRELKAIREIDKSAELIYEKCDDDCY